MKRDDWTIRAKLLLLVLGSLFFISGTMGPTAMIIAKGKDAKFAERIRSMEGARAVMSQQGGETEKAAAKLGIAASLMFAFTLACGLYASRGIVRRLRELTEAAEGMARGDLTTSVEAVADTELDELALALDAMRAQLEHVVALSLQKVAFERDIAVASTVQTFFLPKEDHLQFPALELCAFYRPAARCGGDFWWHRTLADGSVLVLIGDVTGHGTGAAMLTAVVVSAVQRLLARDMGTDVPRFLHELNECVRDICNEEFFLTLCALHIDPREGRLSLWSAGAPPVLLTHADGEVEVLTTRGTRLGEQELTLGSAQTKLRAGTRILAFTDGVPERTLPSGQALGLRRLRKVFIEGQGKPLSALRETLAQVLVHESEREEDDMTFVALELRDRSATEHAA